MSEEQLKAFLEKVQGDTSLQEKLKAAADANAVTAIAKEAGFSISADDINKTQSELSDEELEEGVAGGFWKPIRRSNWNEVNGWCWKKTPDIQILVLMWVKFPYLGETGHKLA